MRVGVHINRFDHPGGGPALGAERGAAGAAAEAAGLSWLSVMDRYFQMEINDRAEDPTRWRPARPSATSPPTPPPSPSVPW
ncbi:hypothetical protein AB0C98_31455 [Streptomyces sp. NPDC048558]|uniref:hypothetical protein n=1 Tax=Streptomyces sp. NPDC048558 TaxID=3155759 RepID=UPI003424CBE4